VLLLQKKCIRIFQFIFILFFELFNYFVLEGDLFVELVVLGLELALDGGDVLGEGGFVTLGLLEELG
jgi:hypothetical protein